MRAGCAVLLAAAATMAEEAFEIRRYTAGPLGPDQMYFKPSIVHLPLLEDHVADAGLEFKIDMAHGRNTARFATDADVVEGSARHAAVLANALRVLDDGDPRARQGDAESVRRHVSAAAAWGDADALAVLLRTCYVARSAATAVLFEVASTGGAAAVVNVLLDAGADGFAPLGPGGRTAFHAALANGHEHCGTALLGRAPSRAAAMAPAAGGETAVDLARAGDFGGVFRRLGAAIEARFPPEAGGPTSS